MSALSNLDIINPESLLQSCTCVFFPAFLITCSEYWTRPQRRHRVAIMGRLLQNQTVREAFHVASMWKQCVVWGFITIFPWQRNEEHYKQNYIIVWEIQPWHKLCNLSSRSSRRRSDLRAANITASFSSSFMELYICLQANKQRSGRTRAPLCFSHCSFFSLLLCCNEGFRG